MFFLLPSPSPQVNVLETEAMERDTKSELSTESLRLENIQLKAENKKLRNGSGSFSDLFADYERQIKKLTAEVIDLQQEILRRNLKTAESEKLGPQGDSKALPSSKTDISKVTRKLTLENASLKGKLSESERLER